MKTIVWFRNDLRLHDHPALHEAATCGQVVPIYIVPETKTPTASDWWISESLEHLKEQLEKLGAPLVILQGEPALVLTEFAFRHGADSLFFNGQVDPISRREETSLLEAEGLSGIDIRRFEPNMLLDPSILKTGAGHPYKVFGAFWKSLQQQTIPWPLPVPTSLTSWIDSDATSILLEETDLRSSIKWDTSLQEAWTPGEFASFNQWVHFKDNGINSYVRRRDFPAIDGTSRLSGYLASGNMSIRALWHAVRRAQSEGEVPQPEPFLRQLAWREFAYYQLMHFPDITERPLRSEFLQFAWREDPEGLLAWKEGRTGFPLVDAGMRELWSTGTIHNRVRMVVASFLIKHLLIDWRIGAEWFRETLVDYDVANNTLGWQWVAGSGFDAAPYFRIFNPTAQSKKFDADGTYIRKWVPELATLPKPFIHEPHLAPEDVLTEAGVLIDKTYPSPIVDHSTARTRALDAYAFIKGKKEGSS
ncbi:cryptochrome/photolyase family protein [Sporosarcina sp. A2]|uniref:cryptochrome/photolyase family protein n=1 Tax=Sporosarcina sp. A2 TaxID=3393449 RepID=UPI003D7B9305